MSQHTPGPWWIDGRNIRSATDKPDFAPSGIKIGEVHGGAVGDEQLRANKSLIAAAPQMLDALRRLAAAANASTKDSELYFHNVGCAVYWAEKAIRLAEGRPEFGVEHPASAEEAAH